MTRMNRFILRGVTAAALTLADPAMAEWGKFFTNVTGSTYAVDADRVKQIGNRYHVWIKGDHSHDQSQRARSSMMLISIDCPSSTMRILSYTGYDTYGKVVTSQNYPDYPSGVGYEPITPETMGDRLSTALCAAATPKDPGQ